MLANGRAVRPSGRISYSKCHLLQLLEYLFRMFDLVYRLAFLNINYISIKPFYVIVTNYDFIDLIEAATYTRFIFLGLGLRIQQVHGSQ